jgi:VanZ family protein
MLLHTKPLLALDQMKKVFHSIYPSIMWTGIIFWLLTLDASSSGSFSFLKLIPHYDKYIHFGIFSVFSIFLGYYISYQKKGITINAALLILLSGSAYGMGMEFYQLYFTNRSFSWWDGMADAVGAALGLIWVIKKPLWK